MATLEYLDTYFKSYPWVQSIILSLGIFFVCWFIKTIILSAIDKHKSDSQQKILLKKKVTQYLTFFLLVFIFFIWFAKLQVFLVSILAVAAAIVLALKELIMCFTGGLLIRSSNVFGLGHRIEVEGTRGFVIEKTLLVTKVLEIGPEKNSQQTTGDIITIPNSLMLSKNLKNESYFKGYSIKSFLFKLEDESKLYELETELLRIAREFSDPYIDDAKKSISSFCAKEGLVVPSLDPKTKILLEGGKEFSVLLKIPVRSIDIASIEQGLNRFFLDWKLTAKTAGHQ